MEVGWGIRVKAGIPGPSGVNNTGYAFSSPGDTDGGMFSTADGTLELYTNNVERLRIDSNGRIGIGKLPSYALDVNGGIHPSDYYSADGTIGVTGTCAYTTAMTIKNGLVTGCI